MIKSDIISLLDNYPKIALAVSGGEDSMALAEWFRLNRPKDSYMIVNVDHKIRGEESRLDSEFVKNYAKQHDIEYLHYDVDALSYAESKKYTLEQSARELRHDIFKKVCLGHAYVVATAHHLDDNVESVLLHLFRGCGIKGLVGMSVVDGYLIRPLIATSKAEIKKFVLDNNVKYRVDSTNSDIDYSRNFLRHEVIPLIESKFNSLKSSIVRLSNRSKEVLDFIDKKTPKLSNEGDEVVCNIKGKHKVIASEMLRRAFSLLGVDSDIEERHIELLFELLAQQNGTMINMPYDIKAYNEYGSIILEKNREIEWIEYPFSEGEFLFGRYLLRVERVYDIDFCDGFYINGDVLDDKVVIRYRKNGDVIHKFGGGSKSLGDFMTDKKISNRLKDRLPIIARENEVLYVGGTSISSLVKINDKTNIIYKITMEKY